MKFEEFLEESEHEETPFEQDAAQKQDADIDEEVLAENIDVQKAVVESLAADKAMQDEKILELSKENALLKTEMARLKGEISSLKTKLVDSSEMNALKNEVVMLRAKCADQLTTLVKVGDVLSRNSETPLSNKVSLLDRDTDIPDRFLGETREHVLEVIAEARKKAEEEGHLRRAQVLEGVLLANESEGTLVAKRSQLEKLFAANGNIVSGPVIEELQKLGISHKNGDEYLLPAEIINRTY